MKKTEKEKESYGICYYYKNTINDKYYIGVTTIGFENRHRAHKSRSKLKRENYKFYNAIRKYNINQFERGVLAYAHSLNELDVMEKYYVHKFDSLENGYNTKNPGFNGKHSEESKEKMKTSAQKRHKEFPLSEEIREKMKISNIGKQSGELNGMFGKEPHNKGKNSIKVIKEKPIKKIRKKVSEETKRKMSKAQKGRKHSEETKEKIRTFNVGRKMPQEGNDKLSLKAKERYTDKTKHPCYGKKVSEETKEKIRNSLAKTRKNKKENK